MRADIAKYQKLREFRVDYGCKTLGKDEAWYDAFDKKATLLRIKAVGLYYIIN